MCAHKTVSPDKKSAGLYELEPFLVCVCVSAGGGVQVKRRPQILYFRCHHLMDM